MKVQGKNLAQTTVPKRICEYVDHKLYAKKGMPVIGNWRKRVQYKTTEERFDDLATSWCWYDVGALIGKLFKGLYKITRSPSPAFKLPQSPVLELKDLPKSFIRERNRPKTIREEAYRQIAEAV